MRYFTNKGNVKKVKGQMMQIACLVICLIIGNSSLGMIVEDPIGIHPCSLKEIIQKHVKWLFKTHKIRKKYRLISLEGLQDLTSKENFSEFDFSKNDIRTIPENIFVGFEDLTFLDLSSNNFKLRKGMFVGLSSLKSLRLDNNRISDVPQGFLTGLVKLQVLSLSHNNIKTFPFAFQSQDAHSIVRLHLDHNELTTLDYDTITWGLIGLKMLFLEYNNLQEIDGPALIQHSVLKYVDIRHNNYKSGEMTKRLKYTGPPYEKLTINDGEV